MRLFSLFFLFGTLLVQFSTQLPSLLWASLILSGVLFLFLISKNSVNKLGAYFLIALAVLSGLLLATFSAQNQLSSRLNTQYEGKDVILQGKIVSIPDNRNDAVKFRLKIETAYLADDLQQEIKISGIARLGWFQNIQSLSAGERWQFRARLKRPSGFSNPGGFDYEKWLFTERITATGYIRTRKDEWLKQSKRLAKSPWWSINHLRQSIHQKIQTTIDDKSSSAVVSAMVVAIRSELDDKQWKLLQQTGTSHLIAISGLHIAVVAGFAFLPIMLLWRVFPRLNERVPVRIAGALAGVVFATLYAMLAGFTLPTQRALLMVIIAMLGMVSKRNFDTSKILAIALLAVLILDPLAAMTASFWLSFLAVSLILFFLKRQLQKPRFQIIKLQIFLSLAMLPLTLLYFNNASLTSPVANLLAIPWVSFLVVPISLLAVILMPISTSLSAILLNISAWAINILFEGLSILGRSPLSEIQLAEIPASYLIIAFLGIIFLLLPKGFPARWLGLVALLPALTFSGDKPKQNEFNYTLLDVGQGMASVVQTRNHVLIYDAGTKLSETFDIGKLVMVPFLKSKGLTQVDTMIISHEDMDHRGGAETVLKEVLVKNILSSDLSILPNHQLKACVSGHSWNWDGVNFEILSPAKNINDKDNNLSCVLRVSNEFHSLLLTGDIEKKVEVNLIDRIKEKLNSEVVTVPHHGSKTSSSEAFITAVSPKIGLISAGYRNRFGHPKVEVLQRYNKNGVRLFDTIKQGAIELNFPDSNKPITTKSYREIKRGFWTRP